ncbi:ABC transporter permease, partial [Candidatus Zixiibacteriota bacterium]
RLTLRSFRRTPVFFFAAVLTIALGIGAVTTMFTVVKGVLLAPLPYKDPEGIVRLTLSTSFWGETVSLSEPEYISLRTEAASLKDVTVIRSSSMLLQGDEPRYIRAIRSSWELFPLTGIAPVYGRVYTADDDIPGSEPVVVLSHAFWKEECGGDRDLIGGSLILNGSSHTVLGVMPPGFEFPYQGTDLWTPYQIDSTELDYWNNHYLGVWARMEDGETLESTRSEIGLMGERFVREHPDLFSEWDLRLGIRPLRDDVIRDTGTPLLVLLGAVGFFLFIACINVANLLVARGETRGREMAVRTALGASRRRLVSQLLTESLLVAGIGGLLGFILSVFATGAVTRIASGVVPRMNEIGVDSGILLFSVVTTGISGCLFGLLPIRQAGRLDVHTQLRESGRTLAGRRYGFRLRRGLIITEVALSVVLVAGSIMMVRSLDNIQRFDLGFQTDDRLSLRVVLPGFLQREEAELRHFYAEVKDRIAALPGVEHAAAIEYLPLTGGLGTWSIRVEGEGTNTISEAPGSIVLQVSPDIFSSLEIGVVTGRGFTREDGPDTRPVVIVNEAFVRKHWPDDSPLGRQIAPFDENRPWMEVVGVVSDIRHEGFMREPRPTMYVPHAQGELSLYGSTAAMSLVIHGTGVNQLAGPVRSLLRELDRDVVITNVRMMREVHRTALADRILPTSLLSLFSFLALLLAAVGVYGLMAYFAASRRTEFSLHSALGAGPTDLRRMVLAQGLYPVLIGVGCGLLVAYAAGGLVQRFLYNFHRLDPMNFAIVTGLLTITALTAGVVPAVRASRADPMEVLKGE